MIAEEEFPGSELGKWALKARCQDVTLAASQQMGESSLLKGSGWRWR